MTYRKSLGKGNSAGEHDTLAPSYSESNAVQEVSARHIQNKHTTLPGSGIAFAFYLPSSLVREADTENVLVLVAHSVSIHFARISSLAFCISLSQELLGNAGQVGSPLAY